MGHDGIKMIEQLVNTNGLCGKQVLNLTGSYRKQLAAKRYIWKPLSPCSKQTMFRQVQIIVYRAFCIAGIVYLGRVH